MRNARGRKTGSLRRGLAALGLVSAVSGCVEAAEPTERAMAAPREIASPAGEGSGEPHLAASGAGAVLSWWEEVGDGRQELRVSLLEGDTWSAPSTVTAGDDFFVNWADFPSVVPVGPGRLAAHWLQRGGSGTYDYGVRVASSTDGGRSWSEPWTPHEDGTPTEHGFVTLFPDGDGWGLVWLDGREYVSSDGSEPSKEMTLRFRRVDAGGTPEQEQLVDGRICDCCQTDAAVTSRGPVVVYRDRTAEEIRDISITRLVDGAWTEGVPVHADGWHIAACPVNGPAVSAQGDRVVVAWFTGANDQARVKAAFSSDAGATFSDPVQIDDGNPAGRVDVEIQPDGSAMVAWLERTGDGGAEVRVRPLRPGSAPGDAMTVARSSESRASGFPQMITLADGSLLFAWTDVTESGSRVRMAHAEMLER